MPEGKITRLVHYSQDTQLPSAELVSSHNYAGYGYLKDHDGTEVFFSYDAAPDRSFQRLSEGQDVKYELDPRSPDEQPQAKTVTPVY